MKHREDTFRIAIKSIYRQVDEIWAILNNYEDFPKWLLEMPKVRSILGHNDFGAAGKFFYSSMYDNCHYFTFDDDLWYPPGYCDYMIDGIQRHNAIVTLHGKRFDALPITSYRKDFTTNIRCLGSLKQATEVHVGGTGVMAFTPQQFDIGLEHFPLQNMADVWAAKAAWEQGIKIVALPHKSNYLRYLKPAGKTIWEMNRDTEMQTKVVNEFLTSPFGGKLSPNRAWC